MEEQHTPGRPADNVSDAELAELVKRVRKDHEPQSRGGRSTPPPSDGGAEVAAWARGDRHRPPVGVSARPTFHRKDAKNQLDHNQKGTP